MLKQKQSIYIRADGTGYTAFSYNLEVNKLLETLLELKIIHSEVAQSIQSSSEAQQLLNSLDPVQLSNILREKYDHDLYEEVELQVSLIEI
ncbi:hypothetical protein [Chroococcus sp. FPU101]|uniref:hypothetical protein n=1 Tax=Chroococcus sp. FPU101 TaxID=1974212 RepID=UPI001A8D63BB|nr:hypothetical protein [Chroococcus sp. FPU101]GFE69028.1 hypothetical protein CFPU101_16380 [Chroococcus sp. FPU101]